MIISKGDMTQYKILKGLNADEFLIRYKLFIDEIDTDK